MQSHFEALWLSFYTDHKNVILAWNFVFNIQCLDVHPDFSEIFFDILKYGFYVVRSSTATTQSVFPPKKILSTKFNKLIAHDDKTKNQRGAAKRVYSF